MADNKDNTIHIVEEETIEKASTILIRRLARFEQQRGKEARIPS